MAPSDPADRHTPLVIDTPEFETNLVSNLMMAFNEDVAATAGWVRVGDAAQTLVFSTAAAKKMAGRSPGKGSVPVTEYVAGPVGREKLYFSVTVEGLTHAVHLAVRNTVVGSGAKVFIDPGVIAIAEIVNRTLPKARQQISESTIERLVDALVETHDPVARVSARIDADNARARVHFMNNVYWLSSDEITEAAGSKAKNRSQTASRWKSEGKVFSLPWEGQERYPAFQFKDGRPLPVIAEVLAALPAEMTPWEIAFWFVSTNSWLDGVAPRTMLGNRERLIEAARHEAEAVVG